MRNLFCIIKVGRVLIWSLLWLETAGANPCFKFANSPQETRVRRALGLNHVIPMEQTGARLFSILQTEIDPRRTPSSGLWTGVKRAFSHLVPGPLYRSHPGRELLRLRWKNVRQQLERYPDLLQYSPSEQQPALGLLLFHPKFLGVEPNIVAEIEREYYESFVDYLFHQAALYHQIPEFLHQGVGDRKVSSETEGSQWKNLKSPLLTLFSKHQWELAKKLILHPQFKVESDAGKEIVAYVLRRAEEPYFFSSVMDVGFVLFLKMQNFPIDFEALGQVWTQNLQLVSLYHALDRGIIQISPELLASLTISLTKLGARSPEGPLGSTRDQLIEKLNEVRTGVGLLLEYLNRIYFQTPQDKEARDQFALAAKSLGVEDYK